MSQPVTLPSVTPILACRAGKGQKLQIPRAQIENLLATDKTPFFEVYVQVQFLHLDEKGNPISEDKDGKTYFKTVIVDKGVVNLLIGVIHP
jgi:hypothetical protein